MQAIWDKVKITVKTIWNKVKVTVKAIWDKVKEKPLLSILSVLLTLTFVAFVCVLLFECAGTYISKLLGLSDKNEALKFLGIGMGGLLVALQALMSYRRAKAMEGTAESQAKATKEQAKANRHTEQGQRQERLKNAIEHLGHKSDSVRLGGAYELFHLAKDTLEEDPKEKLSQTVLDILCAHIRRTTSKSKYREKYKSKPSEEIQSLLTLLFVQEQGYEVFEGLHISLQGSWLNGAKLSEAHMQKADLSGAHMQSATLRGAKLQDAKLDEAKLQDAKLEGTHLQGAKLNGTRLQDAKLRGAKLQDAELFEAKLQDAELRGAYLQGAALDGAYLQKADLSGAHLQEATLSRAHLQEATLRRAKLQDAYLEGTHLQGANLSRAHLQGAILGSAHLQGAILRSAHLQGAILGSAHLQGAILGSAHLQGAILGSAHLQGAALFKAQLQGATLSETQLQGVNSEESYLYLYLSFEDRIRGQIDRNSDLSRVIFEGGLTQENVDFLVEHLSDRKANELRNRLESHIDKKESHKLPRGSGAVEGAYTEEEAEQWIAEYKQAMSEVPEDDS